MTEDGIEVRTPGIGPPKSPRAFGCILDLVVAALVLVIFGQLLAAFDVRHAEEYDLEIELGDHASYGYTSRSDYRALSLGLLFCTVAVGIIVIVRKRRFSLRGLLTIALLSGLLGAVPPVISSLYFARAKMTFDNQRAIPDTTVASIQTSLEPQHAIATWPDGTYAALLFPADAIRATKVFRSPNNPERLVFILELSPRLSPVQRTTLFEFYSRYFSALVEDAAVDEGRRSTFVENIPRLGGNWNQIDEKWLTKYQETRDRLPAKRWNLDRELTEPAIANRNGRATNIVHCLSFSANSTRLIGAGPEGCAAVLWNLDSSTSLVLLPAHTTPTHTALFFPNGSQVLTCGDNDVHIWDAKTGALLPRALRHPNSAQGAAMAPQGDRVVTTCCDGNLRIWNLANDTVESVLPMNYASISVVSWSPDGKWIVSQGNNFIVHIYDAVHCLHMTELTTLSGTMDHAPVFSQDGRLFATASWDRMVRWWDVNTNVTLGGIHLPRIPLSSLRTTSAKSRLPEVPPVAAFSPDSRYLAAAGNSDVVRICELSSHHIVSCIVTKGPIYALAWSLDGKFIATSHSDGSVKLWRNPDLAPESSAK